MTDLSKREKEVLNLVANGETNQEIANKLEISQHTVKAHIMRIMQKLLAKDRTHCVAIGFRTKILK